MLKSETQSIPAKAPEREQKSSPIKQLSIGEHEIKIEKPTQAEREVFAHWKKLNTKDKAKLFYDFCAEGRLWIMHASLTEYPGLLSYIREENEPSLLSHAVKHKQRNSILLLCSFKSDPDEGYAAPLRTAAEHEDADMVKLLVDLGASVKFAFHMAGPQQAKFIEETLYTNKTVFKKQDDARILRDTYILSDEAMITCHTEFNFRARKIMTVLERKETLGTPMVEYFKDQETDAEILEARNELIKQGGNPEMTSRYNAPRTSIKSLSRHK